MEELVKTGDYAALAAHCEDVELKAPNGIADPQIYGCLLAAYLLLNEMDHAKLLWQRLPMETKQTHSELSNLWEIGKKLWKHEFSTIYELVKNFHWPDYLVPLVSALVDTTRNRVLLLISRSYTKIRLEDVSSLTGLSGPELLQVISSRGWDVDTTTNLCSPKPADSKVVQPKPSHEKLAKLTDLVSFLEN